MKSILAILNCIVLGASLIAMFTPTAAGQNAGNDLPEAEQGIGVEQKLGAELDGSLGFDDADNNYLVFGSLMDGKRPIILSFNYSACPKVCSVQLDNLVTAMRGMSLEVGRDFQVVSVSIDPNEQSARARQTRDKFMAQYNLISNYERSGGTAGWNFLTGDENQIRKLADQCGVKYRYIPHQKLFSHPPVLILVSPQGKIVRYLEGLDVKGDVLEQALVEASAGKIGSTIRFLTYLSGCYLFDETTGKYSLSAMRLMRLSAMVTVIGLVVWLTPYFLLRRSSTGKTIAGDRSGPMVASTNKT